MAGMTKGVPLAEMIATLSPERQEKIQARAQDLIQEELSLRDLRKAMQQTQEAMAAKLGVKQENVSRLEKRADLLVSTLNGYLGALGGKLRLVAEFEGRAPVLLTGFSLDTEDPAPRRRKVARAPLR